MRSIICFAVFLTLTTLSLAQQSGSLTFSLDTLLKSSVSLYPGESVTVNVQSEASVQNAVSNINKIVTDPTKLKNAYKSYQTQFKKPGMGSIAVFSKSVVKVMKHNIDALTGKFTYQLGVNLFSDLTYKEAVATYTGGAPMLNTSIPTQGETAGPPKSVRERRGVAPPSKSWLAEGYVSPVKCQGGCGSCVLFAVTAATESAYAICNNKEILDLSEQQMLDCADGIGLQHCNGAQINNVLDWAVDNGQTDESIIPYHGVQETCLTIGFPIDASLTGWWLVAKDENVIKETLFADGPLVATIEAAQDIFDYAGGIYSGPGCNTGDAPHAVLIVGYGTENGMDYWLIKNSWDTTYGEKGYLRLRRGVDQCHVKSGVYAVEMCTNKMGSTTAPQPYYMYNNPYNNDVFTKPFPRTTTPSTMKTSASPPAGPPQSG